MREGKQFSVEIEEVDERRDGGIPGSGEEGGGEDARFLRMSGRFHPLPLFSFLCPLGRIKPP